MPMVPAESAQGVRADSTRGYGVGDQGRRNGSPEPDGSGEQRAGLSQGGEAAN